MVNRNRRLLVNAPLARLIVAYGYWLICFAKLKAAEQRLKIREGRERGRYRYSELSPSEGQHQRSACEVCQVCLVCGSLNNSECIVGLSSHRVFLCLPQKAQKHTRVACMHRPGRVHSASRLQERSNLPFRDFRVFCVPKIFRDEGH